MKIGMIGLGKMGANMTERLLKGGHEVVAYDLQRRRPVQGGARARAPRPSTSLADAGRASSTPPRAVWVMLPGRPRRPTRPSRS